MLSDLFGDPVAEATRALTSPDAGVRGSALERLLRAARRSPRLAPRSLALFREVVDRSVRAGAAGGAEAWPARVAARGVQAFGSPAEARAVWLALLAHPAPPVAQTAALTIAELPDRAAYTPALLALLDGHADDGVRVAAMQTLARGRDPRALPALLALLRAEDPALRAHAIDALGAFGDPAAIPALEALADDAAEAWPEPNPHFPTVRNADRVAWAIRELRPPASAPDAAPPSAPPPPPPEARPAARAERPGPTAAGCLTGALALLLALVPAGAAAFTVPWLFALIALSRPAPGAAVPGMTPLAFRLRLVAPALAGLAVGATWLALGRRRTVRPERPLLAVGCALCALVVLLVAYDALMAAW